LVIYVCRRGPTKYTRNWEDETAYVKKRGGPSGGNRGGGNYRERREDFPSLEETSGGVQSPGVARQEHRSNVNVAPRGGRGRSRGTPNRPQEILPRSNRQFENSR
jgi:hypothetical protein